MSAARPGFGGPARVASRDVPKPVAASIPIGSVASAARAGTAGTAATAGPATTLGALARELGITLGGSDAGTPVAGISLASDRIGPGEVFAALPGASRHGADFAAAAVTAGAVAVLTDPAGAARLAAGPQVTVPVLVVADPRAVVGGLAAHLAGDPALSMTVFAVTGTSGKTTTSYLLEAGLRAAGQRPGVIGTTGTRIDGDPVPSALTTPEAPDLHQLLARMAACDVRAVAVEVSSHALVLHRVDGLVADVALFTNLSRDHLDFHGDMASYLAAKLLLFTPRHARAAVVCLDDGPDGYGVAVAVAARAAGLPTVTVATRAEAVAADWSRSAVVPDWSVPSISPVGVGGSRFTVVAPEGREHAGRIRLAGSFNVANAVLALAALHTAGIDTSVALSGMAELAGVPGRLERVGNGSPMAFVDYAHKPDALEAVLTQVRGMLAPGGRLGVVLGAGGDRDRGKRALMGAVAARLADLLVLTDDNPRGEDPATIRAEVRAGAQQVKATDRAPGRGLVDLVEIGDRRAAIAHAVAALGQGDVLVVAGKGAETGQQIAGTTFPFDDRVVVAEQLMSAHA